MHHEYEVAAFDEHDNLVDCDVCLVREHAENQAAKFRAAGYRVEAQFVDLLTNEATALPL